MEQNQIIDLLKAASAYDNRKPDPASVLAWSEAARRGGWTFDRALDAIHHHYASSPDRIMPGHITAHMRATPLRAFDQTVDEALQLSGASPATAEARRRAIRRFTERMGAKRG